DIMMPKMSGIEALQALSLSCPTPVLFTSVIARHPEERARVTGLFANWVDLMDKPMVVGPDAGHEISTLLRRARALAFARERFSRPPRAQKAPVSATLIAIASSTGGMPALAEVLRLLPDVFPPVCIAQHLDAEFLQSFVRFLQTEVRRPVSIVENWLSVESSRIYVPQPHHHLTVRSSQIGIKRAQPAELSPSADVLFQSAAEVCGKDCVGIVLTGMGHDGANGLRLLREAGAWTISQDPQSALVNGMPSAAVEMGGCSEVLSLPEIAKRLSLLTYKPWSKR
ncbi:MAG TPA: chemotaxis protein CheB, partial [Pseudomonadota bacterium]|nr:chemotaxis protein CheB [Pseudomonadota bacterium]